MLGTSGISGRSVKHRRADWEKLSLNSREVYNAVGVVSATSTSAWNCGGMKLVTSLDIGMSAGILGRLIGSLMSSLSECLLFLGMRAQCFSCFLGVFGGVIEGFK